MKTVKKIPTTCKTCGASTEVSVYARAYDALCQPCRKEAIRKCKAQSKEKAKALRKSTRHEKTTTHRECLRCDRRFDARVYEWRDERPVDYDRLCPACRRD